jgi:hypothetical protein
VGRCEGPRSGQGLLGRNAVVEWVGGIEGLGDAEVEQLDLALGVDQHVAGFQVTVHQQVAVRVRHGVGELQEERQLALQRQLGAGLVDGAALHPFHHEIGQALRAQAGVEQARDVRVIEPRQRLALLRKALQHGRRVHAALEQLDRRLALVGAVGAFGAPHLTHAAAAQQLQQTPGAQAVAGVAGGAVQQAAVPPSAVDQSGRRFGQEGVVAAVAAGAVGQQAQHLGLHLLGGVAGFDEGLARAGGQGLGGVEQGLDGRPERGVRGRTHGGSVQAGRPAQHAGRPEGRQVQLGK